MNETIRTFIGNDPKAAVLEKPEEAGKLLAEILEWEKSKSGRILWRGIPFDYSDVTDDAYLGLVHAFELAVIEKVGASEYGKALSMALKPKFGATLSAYYQNVCMFVTANAPTRVSAMLTALAGEKE